MYRLPSHSIDTRLTGNRIAIVLLTPASWLYGLATSFRNYLYDKRLLSSYKPDIPVIVVGNLVAGGTGKTRVVAWLASQLSKRWRVAILSRGYGRTMSGFLLLDETAAPDSAGDEPMELRALLPGIPIGVDGNRRRGIRLLASGAQKPDVILMDDGFQHRSVKPGFSILLDDARRPMRREQLLPAGLRREPLSGIKRADLVIETKNKPYQTDPTGGAPFLLVTGTARPGALAESLATTGLMLGHLQYPDHFRYGSREVRQIREAYIGIKERENLPEGTPEPVILTTGKDYVKLSLLQEMEGLPLRVLPNRPPLDESQETEILKIVNQYVEKTHGIN